MANILASTDFVGKYAISQGQFDSEITTYITRYEKKYLTELLGVALYNLFIAAYGAITPPASPAAPFTIIYEPLNYDDGQGSRIYQSLGIKEMLKAFIYFEIVRDMGVRNTTDGNVVPISENSVPAGPLKAQRAYNDAVDSYKAIQYYILLHESNYPTYNGQYKDHVNVII